MDRAPTERPDPRLAKAEKTEPEFPQLTSLRDFDRQMHIEKSMEAGLSREEAERHAEEDLKGRQKEDTRL